MQEIDIMAPAGSYESLQAAIKAGAGSIYFGVGSLNMRSGSAANFTLDDLDNIVSICRKIGIRTYLTLNTVMYGEDLSHMHGICDAARKAGISAVIASDFAVIEYAGKIGLEVHTSTQANVSNIEAVRFFSKYADVIVLARELNLEQVREICDEIRKQKINGPKGELVKVEVFVHGALCVSISGKCYMSLATYNKSANRGECLQNCRRAYRVIDDETGDELKIDNQYVMSPSDLCTIGYIDRLIGAGVSVLKIEGRGRKADYVYHTVKAYREAVESVRNGTYTAEKIAAWVEELESVYNRGFWHGGYYMGLKENEWTKDFSNKASLEKIQIGRALKYFEKPKVGYFLLEANELRIGDSFLITGQTTGIVEGKVTKLVINAADLGAVRKGDAFTMPVSEKVRPNDKLFLVKRKTK